jgi:hypothetical protein
VSVYPEESGPSVVAKMVAPVALNVAPEIVAEPTNPVIPADSGTQYFARLTVSGKHAGTGDAPPVAVEPPVAFEPPQIRRRGRSWVHITPEQKAYPLAFCAYFDIE